MSIFHNNVLAGRGAGGGGYEIERSLRFNSSDSAYLSQTPASAGNRKTWTWAGWVKRTTFGTEGGIFSTYAGVHPNTSLFWELDALKFHDYTGSYNIRLATIERFRDPSAWYHIVLAYNSTEGTASNRLKIWVNGTLQTVSGSVPVPLNHETDWNSATQHDIGRFAAYFDGYLADIHFIDGQALDPTSFGEFDTNGVWQPIDASGLTYGTNGFHLPFSDNSTAAALGTDTSGNGNDWTVNNLSVAAGAGNDSLVDSPTNYGTDSGAGGEVRGNYCTVAYFPYGGTVNYNGSSVVTGLSTCTVGDVVGISYDPSNGQVKVYKNGAALNSGNAVYTLSTAYSYAPAMTEAANNAYYVNFGQRPFAYTAPSGFKALCTTNLPEPTIADGSTAMDVALYTGNGSTQTISGLNFSPDLVWLKARSGGNSARPV
jgi:hypothetical protein